MQRPPTSMRRPRRGRTIEVALALLFALCGAASRMEAFVYGSPALKEAMQITLRCKVDAQWLYVEYKLRNDTAGDLYSYDGAPGVATDSPDWPDATQQVYISFHSPDTVQIKRLRAPLPSGSRIAQVRFPPVAKVGPGATRTVRFRIRLPLKE